MERDPFMMHPNPPRKQLARVIFDKSGGTTVQLGNYDFSHVFYACRHTSPARAAEDVLHWLSNRRQPGDETDDQAAQEPTSEDLRAGRYLVTHIDEWAPELEVVARDLKASGWENAVEFAIHITREQP